MRRDWRLAASLPMLIGSAILTVVHFNRVAWWSMAWGGRDQRVMQEEFGVMPPVDCAYDCHGWGTYPGDGYWLPALLSFLTAVALIAWAWWKPKS